ncbi:hypothetical protein BH11ARM1_BH11ARM1_00210 [soil metagenome]
MVRLISRALALMLCLIVAQAVLPVQSFMTCVTATGFVVDICPEGGHAETPAPVVRSCCKPKAPQPEKQGELEKPNVHCQTNWVAQMVPAIGHLAQPKTAPLPVLARAPQLTAEPVHIAPAEERSFPDRGDPPEPGFLTAHLGRAPPVTA